MTSEMAAFVAHTVKIPKPIKRVKAVTRERVVRPQRAIFTTVDGCGAPRLDKESGYHVTNGSREVNALLSKYCSQSDTLEPATTTGKIATSLAHNRRECQAGTLAI